MKVPGFSQQSKACLEEWNSLSCGMVNLYPCSFLSSTGIITVKLHVFIVVVHSCSHFCLLHRKFQEDCLSFLACFHDCDLNSRVS